MPIFTIHTRDNRYSCINDAVSDYRKTDNYERLVESGNIFETLSPAVLESLSAEFDFYQQSEDFESTDAFNSAVLELVENAFRINSMQ